MKKILTIQGHPRADSFCDSLLEAYSEEAGKAGHEVRRLKLRELSFDLILEDGRGSSQDFEPDLEKAQELILWAEHLVLAYPTWWGTMPALMKGFVDRVFISGFAFKYHKGSALQEKLLKGRSGHLIVTMDAPPWYNALVYLSAGHRAMKYATLKFCGISPVKVTSIGSVKQASESKRQRWVDHVRELGRHA